VRGPLVADDVPARAARLGQRLHQELARLQARWPRLVRGVHGRGLMPGLELDPAGVADRFVLRLAADAEKLGVLLCSYLLHRHGLRLLPTLSAPQMLRLEPSANLADEDLALLGRGLDPALGLLDRGDTAGLVAHLVAEELTLGAQLLAPAPAPAAQPGVTSVPLAGSVAVPGAPDFVMASHIPAGEAFCCAAEGMLLALEPELTATLPLLGPIRPASGRLLDELAARHGFFAPRPTDPEARVAERPAAAERFAQHAPSTSSPRS